MSRLSKLGSILSQGWNVIRYDGETDESVSARCHREGVLLGDKEWRARRDRVNKLFFWQEDHCKAASKQDREYAERVVEFYKVHDNESS